ncbi:hypothetical protein [Streptomyces sp. SM14]|nr:hypothetical protein [Streptomyces sp. SM14]
MRLVARSALLARIDRLPANWELLFAPLRDALRDALRDSGTP